MIISIDNWRPFTTNELLKVHWRQRARMKQSDTQMISVYANQSKIPKAIGRRSVHIIYTQPTGRSLDGDALYKTVWDALKNAKLIIDDSPKWLECIPTEVRRGAKNTTIILEDI